ncbi:MAG: phage head closure protein [Bacteroidales bacterium]|nr:phage head closure protein [Bacteroidales bacterium]
MTSNADIGAMDTLVTLQSCTITRNDQGAKDKTYADFRKVWAKIDHSVDEQVAYRNLEAGHVIYLTIYKVKELDTRWRVIIDGDAWQISAIDDMDRLSPVYRLTLEAINKSKR